MNDLVVYASCQVFEVRVSIGAGTSMSPLEQHVIKAAHAGVDTVSGLCDLLGIGPRMMTDLLGDLWRAGYVCLDFLEERVLLTEQVRRLAADDSLGSLAGAEVSDESRQLMLDTLSGVVIPVRGFSRAPDRRLEVPKHPGEAQLDSISQATLVEALTIALNDDNQLAESSPSGRRSRRVVRAYLTPASLTAGTGQRRYRPVGIRVALDEADQLIVRLADSALPLRDQEAAQARLTRLIEDQPASSFVSALREAASGPPQEPATLETVLSELTERAAALGALPAVARAQQHDEMIADSQRIVRRLEALTEQEAGVTLLGGHPAHAAAISQLIASARTQVILACPWISYPGLAAYAEALEDAVRRGVEVVLLWGIGHDDTGDRAITNALSALQRQAVGVRVLISPRTSSIIHAKLAIADDRQAVVTSLNFLEPSAEGTYELGVKVDAPAGRSSPAIGQMLTWARDAMPDYAIAQAVITDPASFAVRSGPAPTPPPEPHVSADPPLTELAKAEPAGSPAIAAWSAAWCQRAAELMAAARGRPASVRMIRDGEHRDFLWTALRSARRRLLITSDGLAEDVVDKAFIDHIQRCVQRGVRVTLIYRRPRQTGGTQAAARLQAVVGQAQDGPGWLRLEKQHNHAKVLVVDDEAVVTSFNFLSFDGYYGGVGRRRQRAEVGVRIFGGNVADRLLESFGISPDQAQPTAQSAKYSPGGAAATELRALTAAQQLLDRLRAGARPASRQDLAGIAGSGAEALAVLAALRSCGADPGPLEIVAATVLSDLDDDASAEPEVDGWWAWLSERRFGAGDFTVAAALRQAVQTATARPRLALVDVAARRGTPDVDAAIGNAVLHEDLGPVEWQSLLVTAAYELLVQGGAELAEAIDIAVAEVAPPWTRIGQTARRWWDNAMRPLPVERLQRGDQQRMDIALAAGEWAVLDDQLKIFERYAPPFTAGSATRRFLLRAGGPLNQLALATQSKDREAVRSWMEDPKLADVGSWVDAATRAAGITDLIHGHLRPPFVDRVADIIAAARAVAGHADIAGAPAVPFDETMHDARQCLEDLRTTLPELQRAATAMDLPERALAEAAVRDLGRLAGEGTP